MLHGGRTPYLLDVSAPWIAGNHVSVSYDAVVKIAADFQASIVHNRTDGLGACRGTRFVERGRAIVPPGKARE